MVIVQEVVLALQMAKTGIKAAARAAKAELIKITDADVRRQLTAAGALGGLEEDWQLWVIRLSDLIKMLPQKPDHNRVIPLLQIASKDEPPPVHRPRQLLSGGSKAAQGSSFQWQEEGQQHSHGGADAAAAARALESLNPAAGSEEDHARHRMPWPLEEEEEEEGTATKRVVVPRLVRAKQGR